MCLKQRGGAVKEMDNLTLSEGNKLDKQFTL